MNLAVITTSQYIGNYLYLDDLYIDQTFLPFFKRNLPSNSSCVKYYTCTNILQLQNTTSVTRFWKVGSGLLLQAFTTRSISYSCKHYRYIPNSQAWVFSQLSLIFWSGLTLTIHRMYNGITWKQLYLEHFLLLIWLSESCSILYYSQASMILGNISSLLHCISSCTGKLPITFASSIYSNKCLHRPFYI